MCLMFMTASVVLAYDGIRRREAPISLPEGVGAVDLSSGLAELKIPGPIGADIFITGRFMLCANCEPEIF
jgi:hypothetical protein